MFFKRSAQLPSEFPAATPDELRAELRRRLDGVQRHRLLQGFPMAPMMGPAPRAPIIQPDDRQHRPMLIGVLPHTFCVPAVKGCGFCTFPHAALKSSQMVPLATSIARRMGLQARSFQHRRIAGIYLGGGTANLTPLPALGIILGGLMAFRPGETELTLEGVPRFFTAEQLDLLTGAGLGRVRISMGVQTFDPGWLTKMGRQNIGSPEQVAAAVALAQQRSVGTSVDLLLNLPGQPRAAMLSDIQHAIDLGVDQICLYHLVLRSGLPVPWAQDPALLDALPDNTTAYDSWRAARTLLLSSGFEQRTLTNFERSTAPERFTYEPHSFRPHTCDALGFGPGAISGINFGTRSQALKWINHASVDDYLSSSSHNHSMERIYAYSPFEDALMQLTRGLAMLHIPIEEGALAAQIAVFEPELAVLEEAGLLSRGAAALSLTERGMFFADSVAGLLAWRTVQYRNAAGRNEPARHPMG